MKESAEKTIVGSILEEGSAISRIKTMMTDSQYNVCNILCVLCFNDSPCRLGDTTFPSFVVQEPLKLEGVAPIDLIDLPMTSVSGLVCTKPIGRV